MTVHATVAVVPPSAGAGSPRADESATSVTSSARSGNRGGRGLGVPARLRAGRNDQADHGVVTAETAIAIPSLLVLLTIFVWVILVVIAQLRVVDAARAGARAAARGESAAHSVAVAEAMAPRGAEALVSRTASEVRVEVRVAVEPPAGLSILPSIEVEAVAYADAEDATGTDLVGARAHDALAVDGGSGRAAEP